MVDYALSLEAAQRARPLGPGLGRLIAKLLGRRPKPSPRDFVEFDPDAYLRENPDVAASGIPPLSHFARLGWLEDRPLSARLDTRQYIAANAHVRQVLLDLYPGASDAAAPALAEPAPRDLGPRKPGVLVVGYLEGALGLGESTRGLARALAASDLDFALYPYNLAIENRFAGPFMPERTDKAGRYDVTVFEANGEELPGFLDQFAAKIEGGHTIFRTYWELAEAPRAWGRPLSRVDEIWAPTTFVARAFRRVFDGPITIVPPAVSVESRESFPRSRFGLDRDAFLYVFTFDYSSVAARKNPLGLVEAFGAAFPPGDIGVGLVLKSTGAPDLEPATRAALALAARRDPRIVLIDGAMSRDEILSLVRVCDCYVSLHRSEGFGFGMAEALALGRPVVATDYAGSTDFLSAATGYLVPYRLRLLHDDEYPRAEGQSWAEPDLDAAAELLRRVRSERAEREARTAAGRALIEARFGAAAAGGIAVARLRELLAARRGG